MYIKIGSVQKRVDCSEIFVFFRGNSGNYHSRTTRAKVVNLFNRRKQTNGKSTS